MQSGRITRCKIFIELARTTKLVEINNECKKKNCKKIWRGNGLPQNDVAH
jgi:hypothetical protein